ncbi:MAG: threonine/serine dehydratase, partial [Acidimicrobiales bacterium]
VSSLSPSQLQRGVVAFSSGNHAQAVARSAALCDSSSVIVMPSDAPLEKVAGTEANGATVVRYDRYGEDRAAIAAQIAETEGRTLIPPYDHRLVIAGQGTVALELFDQVPHLDALFVCVGGGGLLAGCATVADSHPGETEVFGVEPAAGNDHALSLAAGKRVEIEIPRTIADGQQVSAPGEITWPITSRLATGFPLVSDEEIIATMKLLFTQAKLVVEPSGASALAAVLHRKDLGIAGKRIGVTLSGGNIGLDRFRSLVQ